MHMLASLVLLQAPFSDGLSSALSPIVIIVAVVLLVIASLVVFFVSRYKRCPPNQVMVVYGSGGTTDEEGRTIAKVLNGGGTLVWPVIQDYEFMSLKPYQIEINLTDALSSENIRVQVPSVVTVAIGDTPALQGNAATRLLGLSDKDLMELAADIIFGQMRDVIATMHIEAINRDRDAFRKEIEQSLAPELEKVGLKLINVNIRDLNDEGGYIKAIGRKAAAEAVQTANAEVAEEERKGETRVAKANQEKEVDVAAANRDKNIGVQTAATEQAKRIADLRREQEVAEEQAQYQRDTEVAQADQVRRVAIAGANAQAVEGETESEARVADAQARLEVKKAQAYREGETSKRVAQAEVEEAENRAQAKAALADAERIEAEKRAMLEAPAKAEKAKNIVEAEAQSERTRIEAEGEAKAIFAKAEAEARGEYERMSAQARGLKDIVAACGGDPDQAYKLLMIDHVPELAETAAKAISNIKFDKVVMWGGAGQNGAEAGISAFVTDLMRSLPPALHTMLDIGGVKVGDGEIFGLVDDEAQEGSAAVAQYEGNGDSGSHADDAVQSEETGGVATATGEEDPEE